LDSPAQKRLNEHFHHKIGLIEAVEYVECGAGTGIRLAQAGYAVFGIDVQGHGKSDGLQAYIPSFNDVVDDCIVFFKSIRGLILSPPSFCTNFSFLLGDCTPSSSSPSLDPELFCFFANGD
jgi:acylglycerol lipase